MIPCLCAQDLSGTNLTLGAGDSAHVIKVLLKRSIINADATCNMDLFFVMPIMMCISMGINDTNQILFSSEPFLDRIPYQTITSYAENMEVSCFLSARSVLLSSGNLNLFLFCFPQAMATWFVESVGDLTHRWEEVRRQTSLDLSTEIRNVIRKWEIMANLGH